jgi:hypothetical protein
MGASDARHRRRRLISSVTNARRMNFIGNLRVIDFPTAAVIFGRQVFPLAHGGRASIGFGG